MGDCHAKKQHFSTKTAGRGILEGDGEANVEGREGLYVQWGGRMSSPRTQSCRMLGLSPAHPEGQGAPATAPRFGSVMWRFGGAVVGVGVEVGMGARANGVKAINIVHKIGIGLHSVTINHGAKRRLYQKITAAAGSTGSQVKGKES